MSVEVTITRGPLGAAQSREVSGAGAAVVFEGIVRPEEDGARIAGLFYEAYQPMAGVELHRLADSIAERRGILGVIVEHSEGFVGSGALSFRLTVHSEHRKEALEAMDWFIDAMKREVPIWKRVSESY